MRLVSWLLQPLSPLFRDCFKSTMTPNAHTNAYRYPFQVTTMLVDYNRQKPLWVTSGPCKKGYSENERPMITVYWNMSLQFQHAIK